MDEVTKWVEENPLVQVKTNKADPTLEDVEALKTLLQDLLHATRGVSQSMDLCI